MESPNGSVRSVPRTHYSRTRTHRYYLGLGSRLPAQVWVRGRSGSAVGGVSRLYGTLECSGEGSSGICSEGSRGPPLLNQRGIVACIRGPNTDRVCSLLTNARRRSGDRCVFTHGDRTYAAAPVLVLAVTALCDMGYIWLDWIPSWGFHSHIHGVYCNSIAVLGSCCVLV